MFFKTKFKVLSEIKDISPKVIYKLVLTDDRKPFDTSLYYNLRLMDGADKGEVDCGFKYKKIKTKSIPNDGALYLVPVELTDNYGSTQRALGCFCTDLQYLNGPYYVLDHKSRSLVVFRPSNETTIKLLVRIEGFDYELDKATSHLPNDVELENFIPSNVIPGVGFVIIPFQNDRIDMEDLSVRTTEEEIIDYFISSIIHKVQVHGLPRTDLTYYLPANVIVNATQSRDGYVLFNSKVQKVDDICFLDGTSRMISVSGKAEDIEDLGLFIDPEVLSYEFLLPDVQPVRHRFIIQ